MFDPIKEFKEIEVMIREDISRARVRNSSFGGRKDKKEQQKRNSEGEKEENNNKKERTSERELFTFKSLMPYKGSHVT